ncbi:MAG: ABC transporter permease [Candidatus Omnitrophota bacterium]
MRHELFISIRYLLHQRKYSFLSMTTVISVLGVALGVTALIVVIAVMSGFDSDLKEKITAANAHLYIEDLGGMTNPEAVMEKLGSIGEITGTTPYIHGQVMLKVEDFVQGALLRGIDPKREPTVTRIDRYLVEGSFDLKDREILLGSELARKFRLEAGDELRVISAGRTKGEVFRLAGIFHSGMYDYDMNLVLVSLPAAQYLFEMKDTVGGVNARLREMDEAGRVKEKIRDLLGSSYRVVTWVEQNRNLFGALALEKAAMFVILFLIVCVACFNIASSLIMTVMEKTKDIGILKAIGSSNRSVQAIFSLQGFMIGLAGTALGAAGGFGLCMFLKRYPFIRLPQDIYYLDRLPVEIQWGDSFVIIVAAMALSWLATLYPAWRASRMDPVDALRYE